MPDLCNRNFVENILLTLPFGFGISFIAHIKPGNIPWLALAVGLSLETIQFIISLIFKSSFRVIDINDVLLNATGILIGYGFFRLFAFGYLETTQRFGIKHKMLLAYVYEVASKSSQ